MYQRHIWRRLRSDDWSSGDVGDRVLEDLELVGLEVELFDEVHLVLGDVDSLFSWRKSDHL